jgi:hypothetical protein
MGYNCVRRIKSRGRMKNYYYDNIPFQSTINHILFEEFNRTTVSPPTDTTFSSTASPFTLKILLFYAVLSEILKSFFGTALTKVFSLALRLAFLPLQHYYIHRGLSESFSGFISKLKSFNFRETRRYRSQTLSKKRSRFNAGQKEESFDDFLDEPIANNDERSNDRNNSSDSSQQQQDSNSDVPRLIPEMGEQSKGFKTFHEDIKSLKGSQTDIDKLYKFGYNKYRYVSNYFITKNKLLSIKNGSSRKRKIRKPKQAVDNEH